MNSQLKETANRIPKKEYQPIKEIVKPTQWGKTGKWIAEGLEIAMTGEFFRRLVKTEEVKPDATSTTIPDETIIKKP